ncbi:16S rRNA (guanine(966)-N(2))-methyltransferase RsmD [Acidovorax sp. Leaf78]|uniref:16S rRNA (guanine(966)-N(2))-methyltransferase RsmD n=1 Tax=unclassified Acidovorax TaxID=2684926 RepID=UPI0006F95E6D|nr:16S rRNA (guanine(966)-N(2))-methyltransferase RsmD [Acidovorax sp. Leaf78]KQO19729.1 16S rRNA (guanine(966)-N(2))-methyltransferase RsmD [Acidovorax sp. Leaf78]
MSRSTLRPSDLPGGKNAGATAASTAKPKGPQSNAAPTDPAVHKGAGEIRIIGGQWKRTRLAVARHPGLRPTPDRVRETLFNWLGQDLTGWRCLDAFAGTGALGLEAASRGAAAVQLVENDASLVAQLNTQQQRLKATTVRVTRGDGLSALQQAGPGSLDLILLDPPFGSDIFGKALQAAARAVAPDGHIYLEAPRVWVDEELADWGLVVHRHLKAGAVHAHLLRRGAAATAA